MTAKPRVSGAQQHFTPAQERINTSVPFPNPMKVMSVKNSLPKAFLHTEGEE